MFVRKFEEADAEACRSLWADLVAWHRDLYDDPSIGGESPGAGFDRHLEEFGGELLWVAENGDDVIGLAGLIVHGDKGELEPIVVAPDARASGVGRALAEAVIDAAREAGLRQVFTRPVARNSTALRFFHRLGFDTLGHVDLMLDFERPEGYWRDGERLAERRFRA